LYFTGENVLSFRFNNRKLQGLSVGASTFSDGETGPVSAADALRCGIPCRTCFLAFIFSPDFFPYPFYFYLFIKRRNYIYG
jgi:hypothetical protein